MGTATTACGRGGAACNTCGTGQQCTANACSMSVAGGSAGGSSGGGLVGGGSASGGGTSGGNTSGGSTGGGNASGGSTGGGNVSGGSGGGLVGGGATSGGTAGGSSSDGGTDGGLTITDSGVVLTTVSHPRELRGVWVATVSNLDVASGLSRDAGITAMRALVDRTKDAGLNAIFFQVRPESDAWYASTLEPWSRFLTGTQGRDPGWDPLDVLLTSAHERGVEVHAWMNPYRASVNASSSTASNHVSQTLSQFAVQYDGKLTMNPGANAVRAHVVNVVRDVLDHYDVDGVHFDDYFYPYPDAANTPFPDDATFQAYRADGGTLTNKSDWRRNNVNTLVREVMDEVRTNHPHVRFGISPFGIWRPNNPQGVVGLDAYETISCDALAWLTQGTVDYVAPQLYWPTTSPGQPFMPLATWWAGRSNGKHIFVGHGTYRLGMAGWDLDEIRAQVNGARTLRGMGMMGGIHFREVTLRTNVMGVTALLRDELYATPALPPPVPRQGASATPLPPNVSKAGSTLTVTHPLPLTARAFALYRSTPTGWVLVASEGGTTAQFGSLPAGTYAVSAVNRGGAESQGVVLTLP